MKKAERIFIHFIKNIHKKDRVAVVHHTDPDGVSSGVIAAKVVERVRGRKIDLRWNQDGRDIPINQETISVLRKNRINKVIITDMGVDQRPEMVRKIANFADVMILDHHKIYNEIEEVALIKSQHISKIDPSQYCASKLCYDLGMLVCDVSDLDWVAVLGIIGDVAYGQWQDFVDGVLKKYKLSTKADISDTALGKASSLISESESYSSKNVELCFKVVYGAKTYRDILDSPLKQFHKKVKTEIDRWHKLVDKEAEHYENLIMYMVESPYNVKSSLSTRLSFEHPHKTIVVMQPGDGLISISARRQDRKMAMNDLLEKAVLGLKGSTAGGHVPAAGGRIKEKDLILFKTNILKLTENLK